MLVLLMATRGPERKTTTTWWLVSVGAKQPGRVRDVLEGLEMSLVSIGK